MNTKIVSLFLGLAAQMSLAAAQGNAIGLLQWGVGVLVAIILGIVVGAILICVCCGCMCYHCCCKTTQSRNTVMVSTAAPQPPTQVIMHGQPPAYGHQQQVPMVVHQQPMVVHQQQQQPYSVTY